MNAFANALLDSRRGRGGGRAKQQPAGGGETVRNAQAQRQFGPDDREIDLLAIGEARSGIRVRDVAGNASAQSARCRGCPGAQTSSPTSRSRGEPRDERMLSRAAADDENSH